MTAARRAILIPIAIVALSGVAAVGDELPNPRVSVEITAIAPAVAGIAASIVASPLAHLSPQIELSNETGAELTLLGLAGEPFLRIGRAGVFGNRRSQTFVRSYDPTGSTTVAPGGPEPLWEREATAPRWRWYEPRAQYRGPVPAPIATGRSTATLGDWVVPGRYLDAPFEIRGRIVFRPILGRVAARIRRVDPERRGVTFRVVQGPVPGIEISNDSSDTVEITGRDGAPFLRVGPGGVEANVHSATYRDTRPGSGSAGTAPEWKRLQSAPLFVWIERRAAAEASDEVRQRATRKTLASWSVPGSIGGRPLRIDGVTEWEPLPAERAAARSGVPWAPIAGASAGAALIAGGCLTIARRRRRAAR